MDKSIKILIPMGGYGTRLRPLTWSRPKPLVCLAGQTVLDYVLAMLDTVPKVDSTEFIFSINAQIEDQIVQHVSRVYPDWQVKFPIDNAKRGQSDAFWQAKEHLEGPLLVIFSDTIIENDFSFLADETADAVIWVKPVPDPRRFGVTVVDEDGWITELIEKPDDMSNNLAVVGCYYFKDAATILSAIEEQIERELYLKGEFYIAQAINILLKRGLKMRVEKVETWLDAGTPEALLETNRYLLEKRDSNGENLSAAENSVIIPPVAIHPTAEVRNSVIGPNVSLDENVTVEGCLLRDTIVGSGTTLSQSRMEHSLIGHNAVVTGQTGRFNLGDNCHAEP
ncbi:nucleotidyltransferase [bacterium]|nr:nucleotidyltransferase [bacterium]